MLHHCTSYMFQNLWTVHLQRINWLSGIKELAIKPPVQLLINWNTESAVTLFIDHIPKSMNDGKCASPIFIDLSKAFDTMSHAQILENLSSTWVKGVEYELFQNYVFNQKQTVIYDGVASDPQYVLSSVPQGLILGPLLFLIAYEGLSEVLIHCKIIIYADDTVIYTSDKSFSTIKSNLTEDFARVATWLEENQLIVNLRKRKTECMLFRMSQMHKKQNTWCSTSPLDSIWNKLI